VKIKGRGHRIIIEKGTRLYNCSISISGEDNHLIIGKETGLTGGGTIRIEDSDNKIVIGNHVSISNAFFSVADRSTKIEIGDDCLISSDVTFRTSDSHSIVDKTTTQRINPGKDVTIGEHCWIGNGVTILKGANIGSGSIIGTRSVVTGSLIPADCCAVGIPAKVVRTNVSWIRERI